MKTQKKQKCLPNVTLKVTFILNFLLHIPTSLSSDGGASKRFSRDWRSAEGSSWGKVLSTWPKHGSCDTFYPPKKSYDSNWNLVILMIIQQRVLPLIPPPGWQLRQLYVFLIQPMWWYVKCELWSLSLFGYLPETAEYPTALIHRTSAVFTHR